jgi:hypothetical protein
MTVLRCCIDRILPRDLLDVPAKSAPRRATRALSPRGKTWINGSTLRVRFLGGTPEQQALVRLQAQVWAVVCNLNFAFGDAADAEVRITFDPRLGAWSMIGTDALAVPADQPTMNLGFLDDGTVAHEFGHAIGLVHEHANPDGGIRWNEPAVLQALAGPPNHWDAAKVRRNVFQRYAADQIAGTRFDPDSIMLYAFPADWTLDGVATHANRSLSDLDIAFICGPRMYPLGGAGPDQATELYVGDERFAADIGQPGENDVYRFTADVAAAYTVDTTGPTDVYLELYGPDSPTTLVAMDDDGGEDRNAAIHATLPPGEYHLLVRHYDPAAGTGRYAVGVAMQAPAAR